MPTSHLARGGIQKSIARVQAHFSSPYSPRRLRRLTVTALARDTLPKQQLVSLLAGYSRVYKQNVSCGVFPTTWNWTLAGMFQ